MGVDGLDLSLGKSGWGSDVGGSIGESGAVSLGERLSGGDGVVLDWGWLGWALSDDGNLSKGLGWGSGDWSDLLALLAGESESSALSLLFNSSSFFLRVSSGHSLGLSLGLLTDGTGDLGSPLGDLLLSVFAKVANSVVGDDHSSERSFGGSLSLGRVDGGLLGLGEGGLHFLLNLHLLGLSVVHLLTDNGDELLGFSDLLFVSNILWVKSCEFLQSNNLRFSLSELMLNLVNVVG